MVKSKQHVSSVRKLRVEKWRGGTALEDARIVELYWELAAWSGRRRGTVSAALFRLRQDLQEHLEREGFTL